ncbi:MAG: hypothetical protein ACM3VT_08945 [Solirubrobacterales bacterium]
MRTLKVVAIVLVVTATIYLVASRWPTAGSTFSASAQMETRQISLNVTGTNEFSLQAGPTANSGVVVINEHKLVIEGDSVLYRDKEVMRLAPESRNVDITYKGGRATISDGIGPIQSLRL